MLTSSPIPKQTVGRTFFYSIIVLGVAALVQIGAVCWAFIARFHSAPRDVRIVSREAPAPAPNVQKPDPAVVPAFANNPQNLTLPGPTPIPQQQPPLTPAQARLNELLTMARALADRGDISNALLRLREALAQAPDDPRVLAELAGDYEKLGSTDKAMEYWQHIYNLGKNAGTYYDMAFAKINPPDTADTSSRYDPEGFLPGSVLAIAGVTKADSLETPGKRFSLNVPVKVRPGVQIEAHDVSVYVFIKERLEDGNLASTTANVTNGWITSPVDWNQNNIQILQVKYSAASLDPAATSFEKRSYYGYIALVYYKGKLQDARSDPASLLVKFPPPPAPPKEDEQ